MASTNYAIEIDSIILYKFGSLISGIPSVPDKRNSLDITPQVQEISIYESIFSPVMKCELAVYDYIGLFVNFPLSGEEAVFIRYRNIRDDTYVTLYFIIDTIDAINASDTGREVGFILNCVAMESYANAKQTVQQAYKDTIPNIVQKIYDEHIEGRLKKVFPQYRSRVIYKENTDNLEGTVVIPNLSPFAAIDMLADMCVSETEDRYTYLFFQTSEFYNFVTMQGLFDFTSRGNQRRVAQQYGYIYNSHEVPKPGSPSYNDGRYITNLIFNKRQSSFQKLATGYFHNNLFEINIAQKAVWGEPTFLEKIKTIYPNKLNTDTYTALAPVEAADDEISNRTKYVVSSQRENDSEFPISRFRMKWGKDLIATIGMSQVDLTVTIPGTSRFKAGDLFYAEIPEMHGFNQVKADDLVSNLFLITEVKQVMHIGSFHTTVLRINKDSYFTSIDRESRYV